MRSCLSSLLFLLVLCPALARPVTVVTYPAPDGETASPDYAISVNGKPVHGYTSRVYDTRFTEAEEYGLKYSTVTFAYFDFEGEVTVEVRVNRGADTATIRPQSYGIEPEVHDGVIRFHLDHPRKLTIEPDGREDRVLHLFANSLETERPQPDHPDVIYFGPGVHEIGSLALKSNQTVYIAGGAVVYGIIEPHEKPIRTEVRLNRYRFARHNHMISAENANNVRILGRGILDGSRIIAAGARKNPINFTRCNNVEVSGIIMRGSPCWNLTLYRTHNARVANVKQLAWFYNSDGINAVSSQDIVIEDCFLRQRDDGIVVKSMDTGNTDAFLHEPPAELPGGETTRVKVRDCVIWSDWGYALGATYEVRQPIHDVSFENCDIIHATHAVTAQGVLGILVADKSTASNIRFEDIRIERTLKPFIKLDVRRTPWTVSETLGNIRDITFKNVSLTGGSPSPIILAGIDSTSTVENITFDNLRILGKKITDRDDAEFRTNNLVRNLKFR
jgi:polygalacturonase